MKDKPALEKKESLEENNQTGGLDPDDPVARRDVSKYGGLSEEEAGKLLQRLRELLGSL